MATEILYFAWVREKIGVGAETLDLPDDLSTVADLVGWLAGRSDGHAEAFAEPTRLRAAIDQVFVPLEATLGHPREIAIFPPVTGG